MRQRSRNARVAALVVAALGVIALAAPASAADPARVRVLHGSPDAPAVDVYLDGSKVGSPLANLSFGDITGYVPVPAGTHDVKVCAAADATVCPIVANGLDLAAGKAYTIAATNLLASIEAQVIVDQPSPTADKADVRVVHLSADTPAVDVLTQDGSTKVVDNLAYPNATGYLELAPGAYDLKVCAHADNSVCPLDPGSLDLAGGTAYSVFAIGSLAANPASLTAVVAADAMAAPNTATLDPSPAAAPSGTGLLAVVLLTVSFTALGALRLATRRVER